MEIKVSPKLIRALIETRKGNRKSFEKELEQYLKDCETKNKKPAPWWINLLKGLAQGYNLKEIMDKQQLCPYGFVCFNILKNLKVNGFPDDFLKELVEEVPPIVGRPQSFMESIGIQ